MQLPVAFRSLSRPSSALGAKASSLCFLSLDLLDQILKTNQVPFFLLNRPLSLSIHVLRFRFERFEIVGSQFFVLLYSKQVCFPLLFLSVLYYAVVRVRRRFRSRRNRDPPKPYSENSERIQPFLLLRFAIVSLTQKDRTFSENSLTHCSCRKRFFRTLRRVSLERR